LILTKGGLTKSQFDALPHSHQRMYREQLLKELNRNHPNGGSGGGGQPTSGNPSAAQLTTWGYRVGKIGPDGKRKTLN
jgi:hypothetical protein